MKRLAITLLVAISSMASGATIAIGGLPSARMGVQAAEGGPLLIGLNSYYLTVGSFQVPPVVSDPASLLEVVASFVQFSIPVGASPSGTISGVFTASGPQILANQPIYVLVHDNADLMSSTQVAVLRAIVQVFPPDLTTPGSVAVTSSLTGLVGVVGEVTDAPVGGGFDFVTLVAVPEPSTALLGLLGIAGLIRRRR